MSEERAVVFVVDDDPSMQRSLDTLLRSVGLEVRLFSAAQEFMRAHRPDAPGCLVLDVRLPGMSGLAFQEELAKAGVALPVIFITGHGDVPMTVRAMKAGAAEFLTKPFDDQVLLDAIHAAIDRDRARRADAASLAELKARYRELTERERQVMKPRRRGAGEQANCSRARAELGHREGPPRAGDAQDAGEIRCRAGAHGGPARPAGHRLARYTKV